MSERELGAFEELAFNLRFSTCQVGISAHPTSQGHGESTAERLKGAQMSRESRLQAPEKQV